MIKKTDENEFNAMIVFGNFEMKGIERIGMKKGLCKFLQQKRPSLSYPMHRHSNSAKQKSEENLMVWSAQLTKELKLN